MIVYYGLFVSAPSSPCRDGGSESGDHGPGTLCDHGRDGRDDSGEVQMVSCRSVSHAQELPLKKEKTNTSLLQHKTACNITEALPKMLTVPPNIHKTNP